MEGFPLDFYEIQEKSIIYVEPFELKVEEEVTFLHFFINLLEKKKLDFVNQRYFGKLGILSSIKEEGSFFEKSQSSDRMSNSSGLIEKRSSFTKIPDEIGSAKLNFSAKEKSNYLLMKYGKDLDSLLKVSKINPCTDFHFK